MTEVPDATPTGVGETAIGAAMMRAREGIRPDPLFEDPLAAAFVSAAPPIFEDGPTPEDDPAVAELEAAFADAVSVRTRFYDDVVIEAASLGCKQVVILGAGLDARAFRLPLPTTVRLFELDTPDVLAFKEQVLAKEQATPRCIRTTVAVDLREKWPEILQEAGFDTTHRATWIIEGVIPYLSDEAAQHLLIGVSQMSAPGTILALDQPAVPDASLLARAQAVEAMNDITSMWHGGLRENAIAWLDDHGWNAVSVDVESLANAYRRDERAVASNAFIRASRRGVAFEPLNPQPIGTRKS